MKTTYTSYVNILCINPMFDRFPLFQVDDGDLLLNHPYYNINPLYRTKGGSIYTDNARVKTVQFIFMRSHQNQLMSETSIDNDTGVYMCRQ